MCFIVNGATRIELVLVHYADIQRLACTLAVVPTHHPQYEWRAALISPPAGTLHLVSEALTLPHLTLHVGIAARLTSHVTAENRAYPDR